MLFWGNYDNPDSDSIFFRHLLLFFCSVFSIYHVRLSWFLWPSHRFLVEFLNHQYHQMYILFHSIYCCVVWLLLFRLDSVQNICLSRSCRFLLWNYVVFRCCCLLRHKSAFLSLFLIFLHRLFAWFAVFALLKKYFWTMLNQQSKTAMFDLCYLLYCLIEILSFVTSFFEIQLSFLQYDWFSLIKLRLSLKK